MKYILRLITLPFVFGLIFIGYNYSIIKHLIHYIKYGGEWMTFDKDSKNTIRELFNKIENK
jgi:hypothetical protein